MKKIRPHTIVRSYTGKFHWGTLTAVNCNYSGQIRTPRYFIAHKIFLEKSPEEKFCKKCFPEGKEQALEQNEKNN